MNDIHFTKCNSTVSFVTTQSINQPIKQSSNQSVNRNSDVSENTQVVPNP